MKKLFQRFNQMKLNRKVVLVTALFGIIPLLGISFYLYWNMYRISMHRTLEAAVEEMDASENLLEEAADMCVRTGQVFQRHQGLTEYLTRLADGEEIPQAELSEYESAVGVLAEGIEGTNPYFSFIRIYAAAEQLPDGTSVLRSMQERTQRSLYRKSFDPGWYYDVAVEDEDGKTSPRLMLYSCALTDGSGRQLGAVEIAIPMKEVLPAVYASDNEQWSCYISGEGTIYGSGKTPAACRWENYRGMILFLAHFRDREEVAKNDMIAGEPLALVSRKVDVTGGFLVSLVAQDSVGSVSERQRNLILLSLLAAVTLVVLLVNLISRRMLREFYDVLRGVRRIQNGDMEVRLPVYQSDEMRQLGYNLNEMLDRLQQQMEESIQREVFLKDTEIKALQNQINTHFIYNVLESIKMMAEIDEEFAISDAVTALGGLLRYNMQWNTGIVTVRQELDYIHNYIELLNLRYDFVISLDVELPEQLYSQSIPKMSMQPVIENAVYHGLEEKDEDSVISINGILLEDSYDIVITDTGKGMSPRQLAILRSRLMGRPEQESRSGGRGNGIGLKNVEDRIHMQFGEEYGLFFESKEGFYTKVSIHLPFTKKEQDGKP